MKLVLLIVLLFGVLTSKMFVDANTDGYKDDVVESIFYKKGESCIVGVVTKSKKYWYLEKKANPAGGGALDITFHINLRGINPVGRNIIDNPSLTIYSFFAAAGQDYHPEHDNAMHACMRMMSIT